jgi:beta-lactamase regulating signal transducer with metallopeptidase domain/protocatechuate 3,4-dioxygenase beta subunit
VSLATGTSWTVTALALGLDLATKATILLLLGLLVQLAAGRRRAVLGSAIGNACLLALLLLPVSTLILPPLNVAWLPAGTSAPRTEAPPANAVAATSATSSPLPEAPETRRPSHPVGLATERKAVEPIRDPDVVPASVRSEPIPSLGTAVPRPARSSTDVTEHLTMSVPSRPTDWLAVGITGYVIVAVALLARLLASLAAVERLRRTGVSVEDPAWLEALEGCRRRLGINRVVGLSWSPRLGVPIVLGWTRPTILLPASLSGLAPSDHAEPILLHELSHVRRGDYPWNVILRLVQALYWPHPLVWLLGHTIAEIRERICDDVCVHELGDPSSYGETLLAVATGLSNRPGPALGIAMARTTRLVRRLSRISQSLGDASCLPRPSSRLLITATAVAASGIVGAVRLTHAEAPSPVPSSAELQREVRNAPAAQPREGGGRIFHLQVVAADTGQPVPNADVRIWIAFRSEWRKADASGRLDIVYATGPGDRDFGVDVWGDGRAMQRHKWGNDPSKPIPDGETVRLQPGESLGGVVQDEAGRPIAGAEVYLWSHNYKKKNPHELLFDLRAISGPDGRWRTSGAPETTGELLGIHVVHRDYLSSRDYTAGESIPKIADLRAGRAVTVMKKEVPIEGRVVDAQGRPVAGASVLSSKNQWEVFSDIERFAVTTDDRGHFRTRQFRAGECFLLVRAKGHAPGEKRVRIASAVPQVEIALGRPHPFHGRVVDPSGRPIPGAFVNVAMWRGYRFLGAFLYSDAEGRFRWDDGPDDEFLVNILCHGYVGLYTQRVSPTDEGLNFVLNPSLVVRGTVRDAETGQSVDGVAIEYGAIDPKTSDVSRWSSMPREGVGVMVHDGQLNAHIPAEAESYKIRLIADGYAPFVSRAFRRDEKVVVDYDVKLVPGRPSGALATVIRPDGKPLAGARVYSTQLHEGLHVNDGAVNSRRGGRVLLTDADGTFPIPTYEKPFLVLILGDDAYAYASKKALAESPRVQAQPYGRIEGRYLVGSRAIPNQPLELSALLQDESTMLCNLSFSEKATTDAEGRFVYEKVIPMPELRVARRDRDEAIGWLRSIGEAVRVTPGETARVTIGGKGRPVIGRVELPEGWTQPVDFTDRSGASVETNRSYDPYPLELFRGQTTLNGGYWFDWSQKWRKSAEGRAHAESRVAISVGLAPDGSFRMDDMPTGDYRLTVHLNEDHRGRDPGPFARLTRGFTIPPIPGGRSDEPFDLQTLRLRVRTIPKAGEPAPDFDVKTVDVKAISLRDYRGKYLLLDFGVMWDIQSRFQVARLNDIRKRFGDDTRFAILSLVMAADDAKTRAFIAEKGQPWPQAIIGPLTNPIAAAYGIEDGALSSSIPAAILIGPDGKIIARDLWYSKIGEAIGQALGRPGQ